MCSCSCVCVRAACARACVCVCCRKSGWRGHRLRVVCTPLCWPPYMVLLGFTSVDCGTHLWPVGPLKFSAATGTLYTHSSNLLLSGMHWIYTLRPTIRDGSGSMKPVPETLQILCSQLCYMQSAVLALGSCSGMQIMSALYCIIWIWVLLAAVRMPNCIWGLSEWDKRILQWHALQPQHWTPPFMARLSAQWSKRSRRLHLHTLWTMLMHHPIIVHVHGVLSLPLLQSMLVSQHWNMPGGEREGLF